jgi:hypothetical protein
MSEVYVFGPENIGDKMCAHIRDLETWAHDPVLKERYTSGYSEDVWLDVQSKLLDHADELRRIRDCRYGTDDWRTPR